MASLSTNELDNNLHLLWFMDKTNNSDPPPDLTRDAYSIFSSIEIQAIENLEECREIIENHRPSDRIILIADDCVQPVWIAQLHDYCQVIEIYIRCRDNLDCSTSLSQYSKVILTDFSTNPALLISRVVWNDRRRKSTEEPLGLELISTRSDDRSSTTLLNGQYVHSQQLLDGLLRCNRTQEDIENFSALCVERYKFTKQQMAVLNLFKTTYSPHRALWWYTIPCFLHKIVNSALRELDVQPLFFLRSLLRDLYNCIKAKQCRSAVRVYRGQHMLSNEVDMLENSVGELVSTNAFLSTSMNREVAKMFLGSTDRSIHDSRVIFVIDADPNLVSTDSTKVFADIRSASQYPQEEEVLFMAGSIFRLKNVYRESNGLRIVELDWCNDADQDVQILLKNIKKNTKVDLRIFGEILLEMGKFDLAERYLLLSLSSFSRTDMSLGRVYLSLSGIEEARRNDIMCGHWLRAAISVFENNHNNDLLRLAKVQNLLGEVNRLQGNFIEAFQAFDQALKFLNESSEEHQRTRALIYHNISFLYQVQEEYIEALKFREISLNILKEILPPFHHHFGNYYHLNGVAYLKLGRLEEALENFQIALKIRNKALPIRHPQIGRAHHDLGLVYEKQEKFAEAMEHLNTALKIYQYELQPYHCFITECQEDIQRLMVERK